MCVDNTHGISVICCFFFTSDKKMKYQRISVYSTLGFSLFSMCRGRSKAVRNGDGEESSNCDRHNTTTEASLKPNGLFELIMVKRYVEEKQDDGMGHNKASTTGLF